MSSPAPTPHIAPTTDSLAVFQPSLFAGKVLFCTGGGSGICRAMTHAMMKHGADAAIVGRNAARLEATAAALTAATDRACLPLAADVRDPHALHAAAARTLARFGRIDFVVCGAAGNFLAPIAALSENAFRTVLAIDTVGTYNTVKATLAHVRAARGAYVHVSATLHYRGTPHQAHVSAAKAGVDALSAVLAVEEGPRGVRSNVIAPGPIVGTEGLSRLAGGPTGFGAPPLGRVGTAEDVAHAAVFLFSGAAAFITGQVVVVDGGGEHVRAPGAPYPQSVLEPVVVRGKM